MIKGDRITRPKLDWETARQAKLPREPKPIVTSTRATAFYDRRQAQLRAAARRRLAASQHTPDR